MADLSPKRLQDHIDALDAFRRAYVAFLEGDEDSARRQAVIETIPAAEVALAASGTPVAVRDPPQVPSPQEYHGLHAVAFLHEQPGFRDLRYLASAPEMYERLLDHVALAKAKLEEMKRGALAHRRRPLYWGDRIVRGLLSIPAYLVSRVVGVPVVKIDRSSWGVLLRVLAVVADATAVYLAGRAFGLW